MVTPVTARTRLLWSLIRPNLGLFLAGVVALLLGVGTNLALPQLLRRVVNQDAGWELHQSPASVAALFIGLFAAQGVFFFLRSQTFGVLGQRTAAALRQKIFARIVELPISYYDSARSGDLVSRVSTDTQAIQDTVSIQISVLLRYFVQVSVGVVLMALIAPALAAVVVAVLVVLVGLSFLLGRKLRAASRAQQQAIGESSALAQEVFGSARVVKAFHAISSEVTRFAARNDVVLAKGLVRARISAFFQSFVTFLLHSALVVILLVGISQVKVGALSAGDLTAFFAYGVIVAVSFAFLSGSYAEFVQAMGATDRVFEILNHPIEPDTRAVPIALPQQTAAQLEFRAVAFAYPSRADRRVLNQISFTAHPGERIALVGPSGGGKSTIAALALRFYHPASGAVLLNGVDLRDLPASVIHSQIAFVPQEPELFAVSLRENITYGTPGVSAEQLREVCERAAIRSFIEQLPQQYETLVGERGIQLSGGQKQRIAIARAMLRNPSLLILDEATSALDSENEHLVQQALSELLAGRTAIVIAHRLATVKDCNRVIVLENGEIREQGTHQELLAQHGLFSQLVQRQQLSTQ